VTRPSRWARPVTIAAATLVFVAPLVLMVLGSLRAPGLPPPDGLELVPNPARPENFRTVFAFVPLGAYVVNSLLVVAVAVPVTVLFASWAGFAVVTSSPAVRRAIIVVSVVALMVPLSALWVPRFTLYRLLGVTDTLVPLMAPALMATTPFYVLLFAVAYARIPRSLFEAAALENLSPLRTWRKVAFPLGAPAAFAVALLAFIFHWSNFIDPLLYLPRTETGTLPLALRELQTLEPTNHPILLAASVIATLPAVVAFFGAQRAFFTRTLGV
jgi:multiple sugar transport system permease protein